MKTISGRCIWITGASSGLGRALALQLAQTGNYVIASARSETALKDLALQYPGRIKILPLDLGKQLNLDTAAAQLRDITDYLDMVICAAGICEYEDNLSFDPKLYERVMDVNFLGVVRVLNLALPLLKKSQLRGQFVAISSLSTCVGLPRAEAYGSSKAALNYFMQSLRVDTAKLPLDLTLVRPGFIATSLVKNNDFAMPLLMTTERACQRIIDGISQRKFRVDFPRRLSWTLGIAAVFFGAWCKWVAPKITRIQRL